jgi:hypothetical protein
MKKLMYVQTNGYDMLVSYDADEKIARILTDSNEFDIRPFKNHLEMVEDDSSWEIYEDIDSSNFDEWLGIDYSNPDAPKILNEIETII